MYKLHKMQRTLKDGRTDTSNGKWKSVMLSDNPCEFAS